MKIGGLSSVWRDSEMIATCFRPSCRALEISIVRMIGRPTSNGEILFDHSHEDVLHEILRVGQTADQREGVVRERAVVLAEEIRPLPGLGCLRPTHPVSPMVTTSAPSLY